jgi:phenylacetate-CoA ligase
MIILRGVNLFPTQIEELVLGTPGLSPHFSLLLTTRGRMDHLTVQVEARPDCPPERREPAAAELRKAVKDGVGVRVDVAVVDPDTLPRSVGKLKRLIDQRDRG